jgi:2-polyprenyl-3-methyl-5-hydroxy-6-metoxy-1,4-benzoquinol methylase
VCVDPYPHAEVLRKLYSGSYYSLTRELYELPRLLQKGNATAYTAPAELLVDIIKKCVRERADGTWLDVGGGLGAFARLISKSNPGWTVSLNEMNPRSAEIARKTFNLTVDPSDPSAIAASGQLFDVISAVAVLEHIVDPLTFIKDYARLLKPGGLLVVVVPHFTPLSANVAKASSPMVAPPFHASLFNKNNIKTLFERSEEFNAIAVDDFGPAAFTLIQHVDYSEYWDISMPTPEKPEPTSLMVRPYPLELATVINELAKADSIIGTDFFSEVDGRLYLRVIAKSNKC